MVHIFKYGRAAGGPDAAEGGGSVVKQHEQRRRFGDSKDVSQVALCGLVDDDPANPLSAILITYLDHLDPTRPEQRLCPACAAEATAMGFAPKVIP